MDTISIVERDMTPSELTRLHVGFEQGALERGIGIESSERFGVVALDGAEFVGAASALAYKNGTEYTGWCYLTDLYVERPYRGRGHGTELLEALERALRRSGVRWIWTWTGSHEAPRFYATHGYVVFAELEAWYSDGGSRIGLRKDLE
jgi:GNAT superfamily N-acetyltransferase